MTSLSEVLLVNLSQMLADEENRDTFCPSSQKILVLMLKSKRSRPSRNQLERITVEPALLEELKAGTSVI